MLVDAAKYGDVEIPVFCYEPKLGAPVGACRMCLVEIEGIPKLQTACSTPVRDGMVVHTQTDRACKEAQNAVVEFLLVNHPLDCPVCDKGGECPLQDISYRLGPRRARASSSPSATSRSRSRSRPLIAIDRERCILCYRCVRFSQEVAEDDQLVLLERGAAHVRRHLRRAPVRRAVQRQHHRALPRRRADLAAPTASARARGTSSRAGSVCTLCPASATSASRSATSRSCACCPRQRRRRRRLALRQGPLRLPGLIDVEERITAAAGARTAASCCRPAGTTRSTRRPPRSEGRRAHRRARRRRHHQRGGLPRCSRLLREALGSPTSTRAAAAGSRSTSHARSPRPSCTVDDPRHRVRRRRPRARHRPDRRHADPRPADPQGRAPQRREARRRHARARARSTPTRAEVARYAPGDAERLRPALQRRARRLGRRRRLRRPRRRRRGAGARDRRAADAAPSDS